MINLIIQVVVVGLICFILWWAINYMAVPEPFNKVARALVVIFAVIYLVKLLMKFGGVSL